jgi:hypothetical protein
MQKDINSELKTIDSLLRDTDYAFEMAKALDSAYMTDAGQPVSPFLAPGQDTVTVAVNENEEKAAINLAGFYALESGIGALCDQTGKKPTDILDKINNGSLDSTSGLLLNRFANATWKAGQPFRDLQRIKRPVFTVANFLPPEEVKKDLDQIVAVAQKLAESMEEVRSGDLQKQMEKLRSLLQSKEYSIEMYAWLAMNYDKQHQQHQQADTSTKPGWHLTIDNAAQIVRKSFREQKIAMNLAGFYGLECGISYLVTTRNAIPSVILKSILDETMSEEDMDLFSRFANATWKAGQPFRGLDRVTRETFTPFYFLSKADIQKDRVQIRAAAKKLLQSL